nr:MAG TPA: hypothetical protein [Caudoviricetes sp.]
MLFSYPTESRFDDDTEIMFMLVFSFLNYSAWQSL